jgi:hypothetical protein
MLPDGGGSGLFLSPIPVPTGDPGALDRAAGTYTSAHGEIDRNHATLTSAISQAEGASWQGTGAAAYIGAAQELAATYALTAAALARGATTLRAYATDLAAAQRTARLANAAVATANSAASALLAAEATAAQSQSAAQEASQASTSADAQAAANPHSAAAHLAAQNARTAASDAQSTASADQSRVSALSAAYESDRSRALALCAQAEQEARLAATRAAAGFDAASTGLMGKAPQPVRGGAQGVAGGTPWQALVTELADWNDKAGWALNSWGAFGAVLLSKAEVVYLEAQAGLGKAVGTFDDAVEAVMNGKGFFSSGYYGAVQDLNDAFAARRAANAGLLDAIRPAGDDWGVMGVLGKAGLGLGMASDAVTMIAPPASWGPDGLLGGNTDRGLAAANLAASGLALGSTMDIGLATAAMAIPGVDVVVGGVLIGTAAYFAGEFVYQHWDTISHGVEHGIEAAGSWAGHEISSFGDGVGHDVSKALSWL